MTNDDKLHEAIGLLLHACSKISRTNASNHQKSQFLQTHIFAALEWLTERDETDQSNVVNIFNGSSTESEIKRQFEYHLRLAK